MLTNTDKTDVFPEMETDRLISTEIKTEYIPKIVEYASNKNISAYTLNIPFPYNEKDAIYWINMAITGFKERTNFIFAIRLKAENKFIGGIGLALEKKFSRAEIGYWIAEPFWNNGFASEATNVIISFGFNELGLNKITSSHFEVNPASGKVMIKCGLRQEGILKEHVCKNDVFHNLLVYGLTKTEFDKKKVDGF